MPHLCTYAGRQTAGENTVTFGVARGSQYPTWDYTWWLPGCLAVFRPEDLVSDSAAVAHAVLDECAVSTNILPGRRMGN